MGKGTCIVCRKPATDLHHVFMGSGRRKVSDRFNYVVPLCRKHHDEIHAHPNTGLDLWLKQKYQRQFETEYGSHESFIELFLRSYI